VRRRTVANVAMSEAARAITARTPKLLIGGQWRETEAEARAAFVAGRQSGKTNATQDRFESTVKR
jgi:hypothetical protein